MTKIFCSWVESEVEESLLMKGCHPTDGRCTVCERAQELDYGVKPEEILKRGAKQERERLIGVFDIANGIDNCETCKFRPHDLMDCNLADVAILALGDWEQYCPIKKIVESLRGQHESKCEPE